MDRSTKVTLSTYNTWIQIGRLQRIYHLHRPKFQLTVEVLATEAAQMQLG